MTTVILISILQVHFAVTQSSQSVYLLNFMLISSTVMYGISSSTTHHHNIPIWIFDCTRHFTFLKWRGSVSSSTHEMERPVSTNEVTSQHSSALNMTYHNNVSHVNILICLGIEFSIPKEDMYCFSLYKIQMNKYSLCIITLTLTFYHLQWW